MADRRALIEGLAGDGEIDVALADEFIHGQPRKPETKPQRTAESAARAKVSAPTVDAQPPAAIAAAPTQASSPLTGVGRVPVGARVRVELASELKRTSLERQLRGIHPFAVQDILEEAIELWLIKNKQSGA